MIGPEIFCVIIPWILTPLIGCAIGRRKCSRHVLARRAYRNSCLVILPLYYGGIVATYVVALVVHTTAGRELPYLQLVAWLAVLLAPGLAVVLATLVAERSPPSKYASYCATCGYPLTRGISSKCPECGSPPAT